MSGSFRIAAAAAALVACALAGCSHGSAKPAASLTERQRDSILAREPIPGADVVGRAMQASDREARRAVNMDSLTR